jgi:hypothetical protein
MIYRNADLTGANFTDAKILAADFRGATAEPAVPFLRAQARAARFAGASIGGLDFEQADLRGADLREVVGAPQANWREANLVGARFDGTDLTGADLTAAVLPVLRLHVGRWIVQCSRAGIVRVGCVTMPLARWQQETDEQLEARFAPMEPRAAQLLIDRRAEVETAAQAIMRRR